MDILNRIEYTRFLGREFLTWLWYRSDAQEGVFELEDASIEVWFDAKLTLDAPGEIKEQNVIKAETPTETDEAQVALQTGKQVTEARLRIIEDQKQWGATIKADTLGLTSVKLPALLSREEDDAIYERFYLMEELEDHLTALYTTFIGLRLNDDSWRAEIAEIRTWVHRD
ncbi:MAG: hypothetical protein ACI9MR_003856 [Myxococcota bacterium]|jgi:hypothetical protein